MISAVGRLAVWSSYLSMEDIPVDVARSVLVKCLPSTLYDEPDDSFKDAIYELLEKTFCVDKDAVDRIIRFPKLDPQAKVRSYFQLSIERATSIKQEGGKYR